MKRNAIVRIVLFSILAVVLVWILAAGIGMKLYSHHRVGTSESSNAPMGNQFDFSAKNIDRLKIDWVAGTIRIEAADTDEISVSEAVPDGQKTMVLKQDGSTLHVEYWEDVSILPFSIGSGMEKDLFITVPRDWFCEKLELDGASADVEALNLNGSELDIDTSSGKHVFENCSFDSLDMDSASGSLEYYGTACQIDVDSASAGADIILFNIPKSIKLDSASGDLNLTLPEGCGFTLERDTLSGSCTIEQNTVDANGKIVHGDGACRIEVNGLSSSVHIRQGVQ